MRSSEKELARCRQYYARNRAWILQKRHAKLHERNAYLKQRRVTSVEFKLREVLSIRILMALNKQSKKAEKTERLLGASVEFVRGYLEEKFLPGMTWKNHGVYGWHIDHIRPCSSFDLTDPDQQKACFHYSNLQPLWAKDNMQKSDKNI